jgi:3-oxoacyl-[acyl-carrier protein] reductase
MDLGLEGKVALVAAASQGLGAAVADQFAREGARLAICSRDAGRIKARAAAIRDETGADVLAVTADVTVAEDVERLLAQTVDRYGRVDILITNAGGPPAAPFVRLSPADFEAAFQLNMMSTVRLCHAVVPHMMAQGSGSIVTVTSIAVKQPVEHLVLSNSIRLAVIGLTKTLANELGPFGIRVNSILPGWTRTDRVTELLESRAKISGTTLQIEAEKVAGSFPLGRMAEPEEFARVAVFMASPAASYVHGVAWQVDGGAYRGAL